MLTYDRGESRYEHVTATYRFPKQLQIDKTSRRECAKAYFKDAIFFWDSAQIAHRFLSSVEDTQFAMVDMFGMAFSGWMDEKIDLEAIAYRPMFERKERLKLDFWFKKGSANELGLSKELDGDIFVYQNRGPLPAQS